MSLVFNNEQEMMDCYRNLQERLADLEMEKKVLNESVLWWNQALAKTDEELDDLEEGKLSVDEFDRVENDVNNLKRLSKEELKSMKGWQKKVDEYFRIRQQYIRAADNFKKKQKKENKTVK
jgi:hypothetical protein